MAKHELIGTRWKCEIPDGYILTKGLIYKIIEVMEVGAAIIIEVDMAPGCLWDLNRFQRVD